MEFHISRRSRDKYHFDDSLFSYDGNVIFANFHAVRVFAQKMNAERDLISYPEQAVKASNLNAMGLIDEIFHHIIKIYAEQKAPTVMQKAADFLDKKLDPSVVDTILQVFVNEFPPESVYKKEQIPATYLSGSTNGKSNRVLALEELVMFWLANENPALEGYAELISDKYLLEDKRFKQAMTTLKKFFTHQPKFGPENQFILEMLQTPARRVPESITGQLEYIREHWVSLLGDYLYRLLSGLDLIKEENKFNFTGPGKIPIPIYDQAEFIRAGGAGIEPEAFSLDREWMPRLVLIAKNSFVWLDQLSRKYNRSITRLDEIPTAELEILSKWGITGLWLIGLWERSPASAQIKNLCGNPEAISSAYSLYSYQIAAELGGESSYETLRENAARCGIRLASDMVPNHMGIDSEWMIHHPDRFLSLDECPYPIYSFSGPNLSRDPQVTIQIEDHYFNRTDAAVVFRRQDNQSGQVKYVYHGNDGTSMPWNDTAQLNYLNPETREAVIQTILEVAKKFPIIRFDAAMTLAKKHYRRLWFPQLGSGGAIPSRSEYGITQEAFDRAMPIEFWREVVDRAAIEAPDTLLLAEAFWLMEGYFVRTLGMHRVYNSAFMNMLRNEDNAGYRKVIKNTLEFEPEILKRFVNFMNNPDERTAVEQFGKGDKYFGICTLMATMPGLPMLGHGQIEGFSEKYGMEFQRAYWDEKVDSDLVARHEWEIFPLLHQRRLFAGVDNFAFYDFFTSNGEINENVYAYSNHEAGKSALVVYNNNFKETEGWIHFSVRQARKSDSEKKIAQVSLTSALKMNPDHSSFIIFRDQTTGLSYIRPAGEWLNRGMHVDLRGYEHHVFLDFRIVIQDESNDYSRLYSFIGNQGVPDIEQALHELLLKPIIEPFRSIVNYGYMHYLVEKYSSSGRQLDDMDSKEIEGKVTGFLDGIQNFVPQIKNRQVVQKEICDLLKSILNLSDIDGKLHLHSSKKMNEVRSIILAPLENSQKNWFSLIAWAILNPIGKLVDEVNYEDVSISWIDEWQLTKPLSEAIRESGCDETETQRMLLSLKIGISQHNWFKKHKNDSVYTILVGWYSSLEVQYFLGVNRHKDTLWFNSESFNEFLWWMMILPILVAQSDELIDTSTVAELTLNLHEITTSMNKIKEKSKYQVETFIELARKLSKGS